MSLYLNLATLQTVTMTVVRKKKTMTTFPGNGDND
jgi:hypothetical protein